MRSRTYIWDEDQKRLRPAWGENTPGGHAAAGGIRGEIVRGASSGKSKSEAAIERERAKADRKAAA